MISVIIINPKKQDRDKLVSQLKPHSDFRILAQGKDGYDALKLIGSLNPDIAILDAHLEYIEGVKIPPLLRTRSPATAIVIMISRISDNQLYKAVSNEISGLVCRETDMGTIPEILKCILNGGCYISPWLASRILHFFTGGIFTPPAPGGQNQQDEAMANIRSILIKNTFADKSLMFRGIGKFPPNEDPAGYLSKMELKILTCIGEGFTSFEIAGNLDLAVGTVRNYVSAIMRKTGAHNRSQIVRYALRFGLVPTALK